MQNQWKKKMYFVVEHVFNFKSKIERRNKSSKQTKLVTSRWGNGGEGGKRIFQA